MKYLLLALSTLLLTSCLNASESVCESTVVAPVLSATGPKTGAVNQPATFTLAYQIQSPCGKFSGVDEAKVPTSNTRVLSVKVSYSGCNCPQAAVPSRATYTFQPAQAGTYYLQFASTNGFFTDTLVVK